MYDMSILRRGLSVVAQCKEESGDIWHAHYGVAAIASYFFVKENQLPIAIATKVIAQSNAMLLKHEFSQDKLMLHQLDYLITERVILMALEKTMDQLHWVGHNIIYAALSLLAIRELGSWGSEDDLTSLEQLIHSFERTIPGRSWIGYSASEVKRLELEANDQFPSIHSATDLSEFVLSELSQFKVIYRAEAHHDLIGHMLTFSHSLNILYDLGHPSLFHKGVPQLLKIVKVLRTSRDLLLGDTMRLISPIDRIPLHVSPQAAYVPTEEAFWNKDHGEMDWDYGHQFKFTYSYYNHVRRAPHLAHLSIENFRHIISY